MAIGPAPGWRNGVAGLGNGISAVCGVIAATALVAIVVINGINVAGRYFFSAPLEWAEEAMVYLMVLTVFSGGVVATWRHAHISIDALVGHFPRRVRFWLTLAVHAVGIAALLMLARVSFRVVSMFYMFDQRSEALDLPIWIPQAVILVGLSLNALLFALRSLTSQR